MYHRQPVPLLSGVYRPLETHRFIMITMGGYWPVILALPNGELGVVTRDGAGHIGARGRLVWITSPDGGESWSHATVISDRGPDDRNPAFGIAADGTLLASFIRADRYVDGNWTPQKDRGGDTPMWISRSNDNGSSWGEAEPVDGQGNEKWSYAGRTGPDDPHRYYSPFGKMITLADGTILMGYGIGTTEKPGAGAAFLIRSRDGGRTWIDSVNLGEGYGEPAIFHVAGDRFLAILRGTTDFTGLAQIDSEDGGYTWSEPRKLTVNAEHPGDVIRLQDGRLLLTYGRRATPYGIQGMVSRDDGRTWDENNKILLVGDSARSDQGYPSTIQRDDGTIVTVYYSHQLYLGEGELGIHGAAVLFSPDDI